MSMHDHLTMVFPSVTICPAFKGEPFKSQENIPHNIINPYFKDGHMNFSDLELIQAFVENITHNVDDIVTQFIHTMEGGFPSEKSIHNKPKAWTMSIPHAFKSGKCFTYDPPFQSRTPGLEYSIRFGLKALWFENYWEFDRENKMRQLYNRYMAIFIHKKGEFHYYYEPFSMPNIER